MGKRLTGSAHRDRDCAKRRYLDALSKLPEPSALVD